MWMRMRSPTSTRRRAFGFFFVFFTGTSFTVLPGRNAHKRREPGPDRVVERRRQGVAGRSPAANLAQSERLLPERRRLEALVRDGVPPFVQLLEAPPPGVGAPIDRHH